MALYTVAPDDTGGGTEVSGGSYERQGVDTGASSQWDAPTGGSTANSSDITFPTATADWGEVVAVGLLDADTDGNLLLHGALTTSKTVNTGDTFKINAGDLDIALA